MTRRAKSSRSEDAPRFAISGYALAYMTGLVMCSVATGIIASYVVGLTRSNRSALVRVCDTATVIRHLDQFFLGLASPKTPPPDETPEQRKVREAFVTLVKADLKTLKLSDQACAKIRPE